MGSVRESFDLALQYHQAGNLRGAEQIYRQILRGEPNHADAIQFLGVAALQSGRFVEAVELIQRAIYLNPHVAAYHNNLGAALQWQRRHVEAAESYQQALRLQPDDVDALFNLGTCLKELGRLLESVECFQRAVLLKPDHLDARNTLGAVFRQLGKIDDAIDCYQQVLHDNPNFASAWNNLGTALKERGELDAAIAAFRRALELSPNWPQVQSNLIYALYFSSSLTAREIYDEHVIWNQKYAEPLSRGAAPHSNDQNPNRRLKVGYVSPNFCNHSVGRFIEPLLANHDQHNFEITCYSSVTSPDDATQRFQSLSSVWRNVANVPDDELASLIQSEQIDILVDLSMHMAHNRLLVFARKPAPVQVTYLAYCGTTGLTAMDYRLTDPHLDPPGSDQFYSEKSIRLPETYWCYPAVAAPPVKSPPALHSGRITFGCLNNFAKVTQSTLAVWLRLLQSLPNSQLILHAKEGSHSTRVREFFASHQVSEQRITFVEFLSFNKYLEVYEQIDIALDPFPYGGGTTTCDALWMGVPVVTLSGETAVGRGGRSILSNIGLPELVANNVEDYVRIAAELASDLPRLAGTRASLRERMRNSVLMDAPRFARGVEAAYREMWRQSCLSRSAPTPA